MREGFQEGLKQALQHYGAEQTIEGLILDERFRELFTNEERDGARRRLADPL